MNMLAKFCVLQKQTYGVLQIVSFLIREEFDTRTNPDKKLRKGETTLLKVE